MLTSLSNLTSWFFFLQYHLGNMYRSDVHNENKVSFDSLLKKTENVVSFLLLCSLFCHCPSSKPPLALSLSHQRAFALPFSSYIAQDCDALRLTLTHLEYRAHTYTDVHTHQRLPACLPASLPPPSALHSLTSFPSHRLQPCAAVQSGFACLASAFNV